MSGRARSTSKRRLRMRWRSTCFRLRWISDYAELREREYPLLAPAALAERLRLMAQMFPPNDGFEFSIRYRRR